MRQAIPFVTGIITIIAMLLAGNKDWRGWALGLANQVPWFASIVAFGMWGLLPLNVFMVAVYVRNLRKWRRQAAATKEAKERLLATKERLAAMREPTWRGAPLVVSPHVPDDNKLYALNLGLEPLGPKTTAHKLVMSPGAYKQLREMGL